jgi:hypothetical protein
MNDRIRQLLAQITALEDELRVALSEQQSSVFFQIQGKRIKFEQSVKEVHQRLKTNFFRWFVINRPQNLITGPIIYSMIIPLVITDFFVSFFQATCFPIYRIKKVRRSDYIIFDRKYLNYLNFIEKFHCAYCEYANGLIAYIREVIARTEQYFCPIKHAHKLLDTHSRYARFLDYGDAEDYQNRLEEYRKALQEGK